MNLVIAILVLAGATVAAVAAMLLVRRGAPDGSYFHDGDRAAGVFGVLATGFAVLLGFVVFLAFTSYDAARAGAETEAFTVAQQVETAQFLPPAAAHELTGEMVCYARSVAGEEWERMQSGTLGEHVNPWAAELFDTLRMVKRPGRSSPPTTTGSPRRPHGRQHAATGSTAPSVSSPRRCGSCCSSALV